MSDFEETRVVLEIDGYHRYLLPISAIAQKEAALLLETLAGMRRTATRFDGTVRRYSSDGSPAEVSIILVPLRHIEPFAPAEPAPMTEDEVLEDALAKHIDAQETAAVRP